jgi:DNA repair protein RecO (recombination protein O)
VLQAFTFAHGRHGGLVRGGASRTARSTFQEGNRLQLTWRARLEGQLGSFSAELLQPSAALIMEHPTRLAALRSACGLLEQALPDRDPHPDLYNLLCEFIDSLTTSGRWAERYVRFELALLAELGFGLDLTACAVTGVQEGLLFVSPKSGRAVSAAGAGDYADRLLPLPAFLLSDIEADPEAIGEGLRLTGRFLDRHLFAALHRPVPAVRQTLVDRLARAQN